MITDYESLRLNVESYLARGDVAEFIPTFIRNCEAKSYRVLRLRAMETALNVAVTNGQGTVPNDYLELHHAYWDTTPIVFLKRTTPERLYEMYPVRTQGIPQWIAREANVFIFGPHASDGTLKGVYYALPAYLSALNSTNWFVLNAPEMLLYGALLEAEPFLRNDKRIGLWQQLYAQAVETLRKQDREERHSGGGLQIVNA